MNRQDPGAEGIQAIGGLLLMIILVVVWVSSGIECQRRTTHNKANKDVWERIVHEVERESSNRRLASGGFYRRGKIYTSSYEIFSLLPDELQAAEPKQMGTLVDIGIIRHKRNEYTDGSPAYQLEYIVTVMDAVDHAIVSERNFLGGQPPTSIHEASREGVGSSPARDVATWIQSLPEGPHGIPVYVNSSVEALKRALAEEGEPNEQVVEEALDAIEKWPHSDATNEVLRKVLLCKNNAVVIKTLKHISKLDRSHLETALPAMKPLANREDRAVHQAIVNAIKSVQTQHEDALSLVVQIAKQSDDREGVISSLEMLPQFGEQATPIIASYLNEPSFRIAAIESLYKLYANGSLGTDLTVQLVVARHQLVLRSEIDELLETKPNEQQSIGEALKLVNDLLEQNGLADQDAIASLISDFHRERFDWEPNDWKRYRSITIPRDEIEAMEFLASGYVIQTTSKANRKHKLCALVANVPEAAIDGLLAVTLKSGGSSETSQSAMQSPRINVQPNFVDVTMPIARNGFVFALPKSLGGDHADFVSAAVSHHGRVVVVGDANGVFYVFDGESGLLIFTSKVSDKPIIDIAIDPSERVIALATAQSIEIISNSKQIDQQHHKPTIKSAIVETSEHWASERIELLVASEDDANESFVEYRVDGGDWKTSDAIDRLVVDGSTIGEHHIECRLRNIANVVSEIHSIGIRTIGGWKAVRTHSFPHYNGYQFAITPDGNHIAVPRSDGIAVVDISNASILKPFRLAEPISHLAFSHDGRFLAAITGQRLAVFDIKQHRRLFYSAEVGPKKTRSGTVVTKPVFFRPTCLTYACNSRLLIATQTDHVCKGLLMANNGIPIKDGEFFLPKSTEDLKVLRSVPGTNFVLGGNLDKLLAWEFKDYDSPMPHALDVSPLNTQPLSYPAYPFPLVISADATVCFTARGMAARGIIADRGGEWISAKRLSISERHATDAELWRVPVDDTIIELQVSPNGKLLVVLRTDGSVTLRDAETGKYRTRLPTEQTTKGIGFVAGGRGIATISEAGTLQLWAFSQK